MHVVSIFAVSVPYLDDTDVIEKKTFPILIRHFSNIDCTFLTNIGFFSFKWKNTSKMLCVYLLTVVCFMTSVLAEGSVYLK